MLDRVDFLHGDFLAFEVPNSKDVAPAEELEASGVNARQEHDRRAGIHADNQRRRVLHADVQLARDQEPLRLLPVADVAHIGETLGMEKLLRHVLWGCAETRALEQPEPCRFGRQLRVAAPGRAEESCRPHRRETAQEAAPAEWHMGSGVPWAVHGGLPYPFSSFFSSFRNRQSVPWARIFCGLALIIPASWRRSA